MFASIPGAVAGIPAWQTYLTTCLGGVFGAVIFYFGSELFLVMNRKKTARKRHEAQTKGIPYKEKKKFTRLNKFVVHIKWKLGIYGVCFWAPFFLSVPVGSIIAAKFYGRKKITFPLIVLGMFMNGLVTTGVAYLF